MQSHQSSLSQENNKNKILCHKRRPSIGKSMPVTALLLNYPLPSKGYEKLGTDGLLPDEIEKPPLFFKVNELNNENIENVYTEDFDDTSYEIINNNYEKHDDNNDEKFIKITDISNVNRSTNIIDDSIAGNIESVPCGECSGINYHKNDINSNEPSPLKKLCEKLCNNDCKMQDIENIKIPTTKEELKNSSPKFVTKSLLKVPSKIDLERKKFLDEILKDVNLDKVAVIDFDSELETNKKCNNKMNSDCYDVKDKDMSTLIEKNSFHEKFKIADALARTSMMTSPAAKRRLAARKIEMELDFGRINSDSTDFVPPRDLLLYLVRMGSFNSAPKINNSDTQDDNLIIPNGLNYVDLIKHCKTLRGENRPQLLKRQFFNPTITNDETDLNEGFRYLNLSNPIMSTKIGRTLISPSNQIRVFQWNILSQSLGQKNDGFICCPDEALTWENRKFLIVEEILQNEPDIICLQEVDHFKFLERILGSQNYCGVFFPKPDSPCLYIEENNGPDGCAIFYKRDKFHLLNYDTRILEVWHVQSNQVAIVANLKLKDTDKELTVCTTHLKARNGALLSKLRNEQGKDLLKFVNDVGGNRPVLLCGDFNAEPIEPVYNTVLNNKELELTSAYAEINKGMEEFNDFKIKNFNIINDNNKENDHLQCNGEELKEEFNIAEIMAKKEPAYTTWKIREEGEICHTIDYVFYSKNHFRVQNCLLFPKSEEIGEDRTPSFRYPSDHFSLVCDFEFLENNATASSSGHSNISNNNLASEN